MKIHVVLTDKNGDRTECVRGLGWVLSLVSSFIRNGTRLVISSDGGTIAVSRRGADLGVDMGPKRVYNGSDYSSKTEPLSRG